MPGMSDIRWRWVLRSGMPDTGNVEHRPALVGDYSGRFQHSPDSMTTAIDGLCRDSIRENTHNDSIRVFWINRTFILNDKIISDKVHDGCIVGIAFETGIKGNTFLGTVLLWKQKMDIFG